MKKVLAIFITILLLAGVTACGGGDVSSSSANISDLESKVEELESKVSSLLESSEDDSSVYNEYAGKTKEEKDARMDEILEYYRSSGSFSNVVKVSDSEYTATLLKDNEINEHLGEIACGQIYTNAKEVYGLDDAKVTVYAQDGTTVIYQKPIAE